MRNGEGQRGFGKKKRIHSCCWCSHGMLGCVQVTAYSVIKSNGQTGTLPTGVNFQIGSGSNQSLPSFASGSSAVINGPAIQSLLLHTVTPCLDH